MWFFEFCVPEYAFSEIGKHKGTIVSKSALDEANYGLFLNLLKNKLSVALEETVSSKFEEAKSVNFIFPVEEEVYKGFLGLVC